MPKRSKEVYEILIGFCFMLIGFMLPFLMVIKIIESSIELSLFSYAISLIGLALGLHGIYGLMVARRLREGEK